MRRARSAAPRSLVAFAVLAACLATGAPGTASAGDDLGLRVEPVRRIGEAVCASYVVENPFPPKLEEPLLRGMPATVVFEIGVWKRRAFWFDKLVVAYRSEHKIAFDPWTKSFQIRSGVNAPRSRSVPDLDSLRATLFRAQGLPVALVGSLDSTATHYLSVKVVVRPLSTADLGEIEDWLAGGDPDGANDRGLPGYLLEWAVNLSGLGEKSALAKSPAFVPRDLPPEAVGVVPATSRAPTR